MQNKLSSANKSEVAVLHVELVANQKGYHVSLPRNQAARYDLIIDDNKRLYRAQVKYLNRYATNQRNKKQKTSLELLLYNESSGGKAYSSQEIDLLLVYCPVVDKVLMFTPKHFHNKRTLYINIKTPTARSFYQNFIW